MLLLSFLLYGLDFWEAFGNIAKKYHKKNFEVFEDTVNKHFKKYYCIFIDILNKIISSYMDKIIIIMFVVEKYKEGRLYLNY